MGTKFNYQNVMARFAKYTAVLRAANIQELWLGGISGDWPMDERQLFVKTTNLIVDEMRPARKARTHPIFTTTPEEYITLESIQYEEDPDVLFRHVELHPDVAVTIFDILAELKPEDAMLRLIPIEHGSLYCAKQVWPIDDLVAPLQAKIDKLTAQILELRKLEGQ